MLFYLKNNLRVTVSKYFVSYFRKALIRKALIRKQMIEYASTQQNV